MRNRFFSIILAAMLLPALHCQAQDAQEVEGIDHVKVVQKIDLDTCKVYIVPTVTAQMPDTKKKRVKEAEVAFAELGKTLQRELKVAFRRGTYQVIADAKEAPAGAVVIEACLKDIEWGSGAKREFTFGAAGSAAASYSVKVSNAKGLVLEYENRRNHNTSFNSSVAADVIRVYNRVIATDLISVLRNNK